MGCAGCGGAGVTVGSTGEAQSNPTTEESYTWNGAPVAPPKAEPAPKPKPATTKK